MLIFKVTLRPFNGILLRFFSNHVSVELRYSKVMAGYPLVTKQHQLFEFLVMETNPTLNRQREVGRLTQSQTSNGEVAG